jgi:hypothetical protein
MKVLLIGKTGSIIRWVEDMADDLRIGGHTVSVLSTRNPLLGKQLQKMLLSPIIRAPLATRLVGMVKRIAPDLVLVIGAFDHAPKNVLEHLARAPGRPPLAAWIGDTFTAEIRHEADLFDLIAYTDTGLKECHDQFGFCAASAFVPLAATRAFRSAASESGHVDRLVFVGAATPNRLDLLMELKEPVTLFGPDWRKQGGMLQHERKPRRIGARELSDIYARHLAVLNIRHGVNVINGLNQRHFAPYVQGTPAVTDAQPDLAHCFEIGTEILVYHDPAELDSLSAKLRRDPGWATAVGQAGRKRVLAHHTYNQRLATIAAACGIRVTSV